MMGTGRAEYTVEGMSCVNCAASVDEEVRAVDGVREVSVDHNSGGLHVLGEGFDEKRVEAAVVAAGYRLAERA